MPRSLVGQAQRRRRLEGVSGAVIGVVGLKASALPLPGGGMAGLSGSF